MKPLKRHPALIGLSRDHHHSLSLCVRLLRTPEERHRDELEPHFAELETHFREEEAKFAPIWQNVAPELKQRFEKDHARLRQMMASPEYGNAAWNTLLPQPCATTRALKNASCFPPPNRFCRHDSVLRQIY